MRKTVCRLAWLAGAVILQSAAQAADPAAAPLFASDETLHVQIEGPLATMKSERSNTDYYEGSLSYEDADGSRHTLELKFRTRGNYRRRKDRCRFPPVRLNFKRKQTVGTEFEGQNILKLVTHCRPTSDRYEQFVLKELLAYKIFELHSPYSFRTRLMRITWVDTDGEDEPEERYAFVIEHKNALAQRVGLENVELPRIKHAQLDVGQASLAAMFQYFIGNTDFSLIAGPPDDGCCHNSILLTADNETFVPVPYDFDFSGLVDAPYAEPNPRFKIKRVTSRLYRGNCAYSAGVPEAVDLMLAKQAAVEDLIASQPDLSRSTLKKANGFVERFYNEIADPERVGKKFVKECS